MPSKSEQAQIARIHAELTATAERAVRTVAASVLDGVAKNTPRDTGASAASWRANFAKVGPVVKRSGNSVRTAEGQQAESRARLLGYRLAQGRLNIGSAQPGIRALNAGSSAREPAAFVQRAIRKALTLLRIRP